MPSINAICQLPFAICKSNPRRLKANGYTLIELLVVIGILAISISAILAFLTATLKSSNQVAVNSETKQNADLVLATLEKQIRNATGAVDLDTPPNHKNIKLIRPDAYPFYISCANDNVSPPSKATNGYIATYEGSISNPNINTDYITLSNFNLIDVQSCKFTVLSNPGVPPIVSISFDVAQSVSATARQDFKSTFHMQTSISLRQYY